MKYTVVKMLKFCCAHRLWKHEGACRNTHGHNYKASIFVQGDTLDSIDRLLDFDIIKQKIGEWIDKHWDHGVLYNVNDSEAAGMVNLYPVNKGFALSGNPTAELMAEYLLKICKTELDNDNYRVVKVQLWETDDSYVEVCSE